MKDCLIFCARTLSLGLVLSAAVLWVGIGKKRANANMQKYRDKDTALGGTLWSQSIIPICLIVSDILDEENDFFLVLYFIVTGVLLLIPVGIILIVGESIALIAMHREVRTDPPDAGLEELLRTPPSHTYMAMGIICCLAGLAKLAEIILFIIKNV